MKDKDQFYSDLLDLTVALLAAITNLVTTNLFRYIARHHTFRPRMLIAWLGLLNSPLSIQNDLYILLNYNSI